MDDGAELRSEDPDLEELPDGKLFWRWAARSTRPYVGWVLMALGAVAIALGWYGVSGESLVAKQLPFLISGGITGMVLVAVGAFFLGTEDLRRQLARLDTVERQVAELHAVLLSRVDTADGDRPDDGSSGRSRGRVDRGEPLVALGSGSSYHRPGCQMVAGKRDVEAVTPRTISRRALRPCSLCDPEPATT